MNKSESIAKLAGALSSFQSEVKQPLKDKTNPFFKSKYVPLENVVEVITETASKHGLSFLQYPVNQENKIGVVTMLMHNSGEFIETEPIFVLPPKTDAQGAGSVITYLKRYSLAAVFGITSDVDDDGNEASKPSTVSLPDVLAEKAKKLNMTQKDLYAEVSSSLNINKATKELTDTEKNAIISVLIKK
ncbi:ERF family protein [Sporosarcina newyorkensis]|uniref:ERF family protein n=1 Tax=Sporosarcina newyorkensis TaxID=759851 RepID=UPI003D048693